MLFNYDWWFDGPYEGKIEEAKGRCTRTHFPDVDMEKAHKNKPFMEFYGQLEARTIIYLRDGFSYEVKEIIPQSGTSSLSFECMPADEAYKVGCFVVTIPFDDICRVEIFAVHPEEKPEDMPSIKGFASSQQQPPASRSDENRPRREGKEPAE